MENHDMRFQGDEIVGSKVRIGYTVELHYEVDGPADFIFNVHAARTPQQRVVAESFAVTPKVDVTFEDSPTFGNRLARLRAEPGTLGVRYAGTVEIAHYLAEVASTVDFQVFVCDPREEYREAWRARGATWLDGMPDDAVVAFRPDGHSVILTVSHDPKLDDMALLEALKGDAFYVGAVGSSRTSAERRKRLAEFDLTPQQIARLRGPVGLAIGSRTPPEIALAILGDLVASRNGIVLEAAARDVKRLRA